MCIITYRIYSVFNLLVDIIHCVKCGNSAVKLFPYEVLLKCLRVFN